MLTCVLYCLSLVLCRSGGEVVRGYDFLVNAVWPEIISNIEARVPSIFAPGNPEVFHAVSFPFNQSIKKCIPHVDNKVQHIQEEIMWERGKLNLILIIHFPHS